jgi:hypothetical protein
MLLFLLAIFAFSKGHWIIGLILLALLLRF